MSDVRDRGRSCQLIYLVLIRQQLSEDLNHNCKSVGIPSACGVLFQVRLKLHGYTVAAKAASIDFVHRLKRDAIIHEHAYLIQDIHVPVYLSKTDLETIYFYQRIAKLAHMMFLGSRGNLISSKYLNTEQRPYVIQ